MYCSRSYQIGTQLHIYTTVTHLLSSHDQPTQLATQSYLCSVYLWNPPLICCHPSSTVCIFLITTHHLSLRQLFITDLKLICFTNPFLRGLLIITGLPSRILNLYWTTWALAQVFFKKSYALHKSTFCLFLTCFSFVCSIQLITLSFGVHVKLFSHVVSYCFCASTLTSVGDGLSVCLLTVHPVVLQATTCYRWVGGNRLKVP